MSNIIVKYQPYSKEEFAKRGDRWYETEIRQKVEAGNYGKIVAIDIETGAFENILLRQAMNFLIFNV